MGSLPYNNFIIAAPSIIILLNYKWKQLSLQLSTWSVKYISNIENIYTTLEIVSVSSDYSSNVSPGSSCSQCSYCTKNSPSFQSQLKLKHNQIIPRMRMENVGELTLRNRCDVTTALWWKLRKWRFVAGETVVKSNYINGSFQIVTTITAHTFGAFSFILVKYLDDQCFDL